MSFRIDDILKKEDNNRALENCDTTASGLMMHHPWHQQLADCGSILEQTLMNNRGFVAATSINNKQHQPCDLYSAKLLSSATAWLNCDKIGYMPMHYEALMEKANPYMSPYPRRIWPVYSSIPAFMMPYHYAHYSKRKGGQVRFTANQTDALEKRFNSNKYLSPEDRRLLADSLKLTDRQVKTWFQNRRAKWRRCNNTTTNPTDAASEIQEDSESENEICDTSHADSPELKNLKKN